MSLYAAIEPYLQGTEELNPEVMCYDPRRFPQFGFFWQLAKGAGTPIVQVNGSVGYVGVQNGKLGPEYFFKQTDDGIIVAIKGLHDREDVIQLTPRLAVRLETKPKLPFSEQTLAEIVRKADKR